MDPQSIRSIYLIAICGTGMASLAGLLKESGYDVTGSDAHVYPPMSTLLDQAGIAVRPGYRRDNITDDIDLVVVGNAVSKSNEEVQAVLERGIPYTSFPDALARFFLDGRTSLVVAGTHGKTTTAALLSWVLTSAGRDPGFMVGGWLKNFDSNYRVPGGEFFVTEGDEYDTAFFDKGPKFLHYRPDAAILTGIEFDHADIFRDLDSIKDSFRKFVKMVRSDGFLLVRFGDRTIPDVLGDAPCAVETYGPDPRADWSVHGYRREDAGAVFTLRHGGADACRIRLPMTGRHNAENAAAVAALALKLGLTPDEVAAGFRGFRGIKRRQEVVGTKRGVTVIDDFAHHPTAIHRTLEAVKEAYPEGRVWAVFEPRSATSRRKVFQDAFPESFAVADEVVIAGLHAPEKIPLPERLDPQRVAADICKNGGRGRFVPDVEGIVEILAAECREGDVVLVMSSGGFGGIHRKLLDRL